jgi:hypothetical protein
LTDTVTISLSVHELRAIKSAMKSHLRKLRAECARSTFVPEEGRVNLVKARLETAQSAFGVVLRADPSIGENVAS